MIQAVGPAGRQSPYLPALNNSIARDNSDSRPGRHAQSPLLHRLHFDAAQSDGKIDEPGYVVRRCRTRAPRLYLAAGVTTMRTTGSLEPYTDIKVKQRIDAGLMPGPKIDLTAPYLEGKPTFFAQMHELTGA